jgi:hypothetical protein
MPVVISGTNGITNATWTTATRPSAPSTGQQGYNSTLSVMEFYNGSAWVQGGGLSLQSVQTTGFTAIASNIYPCNTTSAAFTVTLPASPIAGNQVQIIDYAGTFATKNITLARNGSNITGVADNYALTTNRESIILTYIDATQGWVVSSAAYTISPLSVIYTASYLVVAGGGGGGSNIGAGGGAGGYLTGTVSLAIGSVYTATVGSGGAATTTGNNSVFSSITSSGGGGGGNYGTNGKVGGSGGGGGVDGGNGAAGTSGQGNAGGNGVASISTNFPSGGGGGASAVGANGTSNGASGAGGAGTASSITGSSVTYAGGGGGGSFNNAVGAGGAGGGGGGASGTGPTAGTAGTANTGGGGGGGSAASGNGGAGGSGIVIVSVPTANYSGTTTGSPTITTSGSNTIIKFTSSGTYTA